MSTSSELDCVSVIHIIQANFSYTHISYTFQQSTFILGYFNDRLDISLFGHYIFWNIIHGGSSSTQEVSKA
jgi:hypothetical protein